MFDEWLYDEDDCDNEECGDDKAQTGEAKVLWGYYMMETDTGDLQCVRHDRLDEWSKTQSTDPEVIKAKKAQREKDIAEGAKRLRELLDKKGLL